MNKNKKIQTQVWIDLYQKYHKFLSQTQSQTFYLYYVKNLSITEIAKILATTRQAINDALKKARHKLKSVALKIKN